MYKTAKNEIKVSALELAAVDQAGAAMKEHGEEVEPRLPKPRGLHIKKRALKNKALSVSFDEKDLRDYVTGFHKRKKKRRKEALKSQGEAERRKRIEARKKRKLQKEFVLYGGAPPTTDSGAEEEGQEVDEDKDPLESIDGTTTYESGELTVTVKTSEISEEKDGIKRVNKDIVATRRVSSDRKHNLPVSSSKSFKKASKQKRKPKIRSKRDKKKGKVKDRKH